MSFFLRLPCTDKCPDIYVLATFEEKIKKLSDNVYKSPCTDDLMTIYLCLITYIYVTKAIYSLVILWLSFSACQGQDRDKKIFNS